MSQVNQAKVNGLISVPPDTVRDVGPNHYVQAVNVAVAGCVRQERKNLNACYPPGNGLGRFCNLYMYR